MKYKNVLIYAFIVFALVLILVFVNDLSDSMEMLLFAAIIIITSAFTYTNRRQR